MLILCSGAHLTWNIFGVPSIFCANCGFGRGSYDL